jgi:hypothetical protein
MGSKEREDADGGKEGIFGENTMDLLVIYKDMTVCPV